MTRRDAEPAAAGTAERARRIQAALDDFYEMLATVPVVGVTRWSELDQLSDLIGRHPGAARRILEQNAPPETADTGDPDPVVRRG